MRDTRFAVHGAEGLRAVIILGLDYGERRIGMAVSDELEIAAHPLPTLARDGGELDRIALLAQERGATRIVVGMPIRMDGTEGPQARKVRGFVQTLRKRLPRLEVETMDERLTTAQAQRFLIQGNVRREQRKEKVDKTAAAILLQSYLDGLG